MGCFKHGCKQRGAYLAVKAMAMGLSCANENDLFGYSDEFFECFQVLAEVKCLACEGWLRKKLRFLSLYCRFQHHMLMTLAKICGAAI